MSRAPHVAILATVTIGSTRHAFETLGEVEAFVAGLVRECREATVGRKAAQLAERDAAMKLGAVLVQLKRQVPHGEWTLMYARLGLHRKRAQACIRLAAVTGPDGRMKPDTLEQARADRLARMSVAARQYWSAQPVFTRPAAELGHHEVCTVLGVRPLPGLTLADADRVPTERMVKREQIVPFSGNDRIVKKEQVVPFSADVGASGTGKRGQVGQMTLAPLFEAAERARASVEGLLARVRSGEVAVSAAAMAAFADRLAVMVSEFVSAAGRGDDSTPSHGNVATGRQA